MAQQQEHKIGDLVYNESYGTLGYISEVITKGKKDKYGRSFPYGIAYEITWVSGIQLDKIEEPIAVYYKPTLEVMRKSYMELFECHQNTK